MFCYQCEQTVNGTGCTQFGNCGKDATTAALQDILLYVTVVTSRYAHRARPLGAKDSSIDRTVLESLFTTVTNVNFDPQRLHGQVQEAIGTARRAKAMYEQACAAAGQTPDDLPCPGLCGLETDIDALVLKAEEMAIVSRLTHLGPDVTGLQELLTYGLKGTAAYAHHALMLGYEDESVFAGIHDGLNVLASGPYDEASLTARCLWVGELNLKVMALLDAANTGSYGHPAPTPVRVTPVKGKAIVVSGHDLKDLEELLKQTEGKGINVYTHGEMLPAHGYPGLKKYAHLVGNYGGAWQVQAAEFSEFPGAILMTTNCIQRPASEYAVRIFTCGMVAWPGVVHIADRDFTPVITAALAATGFTEDAEEQSILVGFGHNAIMENAGTVIEAVKSGALRHIFLIGGCDGALHGRNYFTELAQAVPDDCVILTLACGKYRFNKLEFGTLGGLPRLLDVGQCNDAYSAIVVASALAEAFGCGVNDLPLSLILSWYEQKAVAILLTLLHLGIKGIRLGPTLPAFVTPKLLNTLVDAFGIQPITTPEQDLATILG
ncbi:MAG TPA: hydroxylamine reductase [Armatimonadota bacterium]